MNYLAHAYLSFNQPEILIGNMISDFVKGKTKFNYPEKIQKGIALHRAIDEFTDKHPNTLEAKQYFKPAYRLYAGAFIDVVYDHFLATDEKEFNTPSHLQVFSEQVYETLQQNIELLPLNFRSIFPHMKQHDWLFNYRLRTGVHQSFKGLKRRASYIAEIDSAILIFENNYSQLKKSYNAFFPQLKNFSLEFFKNQQLM